MTNLRICATQNKLTVLIYIIFASVLLYRLLASVKQILKWLLAILLVVVYFQYSQCYHPLSCELLLHLTLFILVCCINLSYITQCYIDIISVCNSVSTNSFIDSLYRSTTKSIITLQLRIECSRRDQVFSSFNNLPQYIWPRPSHISNIPPSLSSAPLLPAEKVSKNIYLSLSWNRLCRFHHCFKVFWRVSLLTLLILSVLFRAVPRQLAPRVSERCYKKPWSWQQTVLLHISAMWRGQCSWRWLCASRAVTFLP